MELIEWFENRILISIGFKRVSSLVPIRYGLIKISLLKFTKPLLTLLFKINIFKIVSIRQIAIFLYMWIVII